MAGCHFFGKEQVLSAYESRGIETWALFQGKDLLMSGSDRAELAAALDMVAPGAAVGTYTLKVYQDCEDHNRLTNKTECNGSFNFKFADAAATTGVAGVMRAGTGLGLVEQRINAAIATEVDKVIQNKLNGSEQKRERRNIGDVLMDYLDDPDSLVAVIGAIKNLFSRVPPAGIGMPVALAGSPTRIGVTTTPMSDEQRQAQAQRLAAALDKLEKVDPKLVDNIEKLADIATSDPDTYRFLIKKLNAF